MVKLLQTKDPRDPFHPYSDDFSESLKNLIIVPGLGVESLLISDGDVSVRGSGFVQMHRIFLLFFLF